MDQWTSKYEPTTVAGVVGTQFIASKILGWLKNWTQGKIGEASRAISQGRFGACNGDMYRKALLISGPAGIGKSLLAKLCLAEAGIKNVLELDTTAKCTKNALKEMEEAFGSRKINSFFTGKLQFNKAEAVVIDGLECVVSCDPSGMQQLTEFIKTTRVPMICISNSTDGGNKSIKSFAEKCLHLRMQRPTVDQVALHLSTVEKKWCEENKKPRKLTLQYARDIASAVGCDVRQAVIELQFLSIDTGSLPEYRTVANVLRKSELSGTMCDRLPGIFDLVPRMFSGSRHMGGPARPLLPLIFDCDLAWRADPFMAALLVQENYLNVSLRPKSDDSMALLASAADDMSSADVRSNKDQNVEQVFGLWSPLHTLSAPLAPGVRTGFPTMLGKMSTTKKNHRLCLEMFPGKTVVETASQWVPTLADVLTAGCGRHKAALFKPKPGVKKSAQAAPTKENLDAAAFLEGRAATVMEMNLGDHLGDMCGIAWISEKTAKAHEADRAALAEFIGAAKRKATTLLTASRKRSRPKGGKITSTIDADDISDDETNGEEEEQEQEESRPKKKRR